MPLYANITTATQPNKDGGYKPTLFFSPLGDITTWQYPTGAGLVLGDSTNIAIAHTWAANKGAYQWETKIGSVKLTADTQGDEGAKVPVWKAEIEIMGFDAATLEQMVNSLNDQKVIWLKDSNCITANQNVQMGDECNPVTVSWNFDGKDSLPTSTGTKGFMVTILSKKLYTYTAVIDTTF